MARRLVVTENITLDGVVENDGSWFDPTEDSLSSRSTTAGEEERRPFSYADRLGCGTPEARASSACVMRAAVLRALMSMTRWYSG